jgi:hypothetical protein
MPVEDRFLAGGIVVPIAGRREQRYIPPMNTMIVILLIFCLVLVLGTLATGLIFMARGGENAPKRSNTFMRYRVVFQGIALLLVLILMTITKD